MAGVIDQGTYRKGSHVFSREGPEQGVEGVDLLECRIQPLLIGRGGEYDRHPGVDFGHEIVRLRCDDGAGLDRLACRRLPVFPQSSKGEGSSVS